jgi:hypothetical protein
MAGRHPQGMRERDERAHPVVRDAMDRGFVGSGRFYEVPGFASREAANEGRKSINNACRHLGVSCRSREAEDLHELTDGTWKVTFRLWPKNEGRAHIRQATGGDPANLSYNPFARAEAASFDDDGRSLR